MLFYSGWLTLIVMLSLPVLRASSRPFITPALRGRLHEKFNRGAENQAFLVETINGIDTVKAMAVEPQLTRRWDNQLAAYVSAGFRTATLGTIANGGVTLIGKLVTWPPCGSAPDLVIDGELTVGQLIAFNMLAGRVAQPVMRMAQLWTDFQQTGISVQRLGDILNTPHRTRGQQEQPAADSGAASNSTRSSSATGPMRPKCSAASTLDHRARRSHRHRRPFRLRQEHPGQAGAAPLRARNSGRVLVDGMDIAVVDTTSLRRQIGVVLQENMLFNRSIRENIALSDPGAADGSGDRRPPKLAGAHEFILELPEGYDTMVGEHGSTLSGGQRQRIAIARALITNPRILIFDEATSALDYESERIIQNNMKAICQGRTVIIIAHRLSAVRDANRILVMDRGRLSRRAAMPNCLGMRPGTTPGCIACRWVSA